MLTAIQILPLAVLSQYFFGPILFILSLFMILLILVQRGKGGGLTGALGGPGGQSVFGSKAGDLFTRITVVVAAIWIFLLAFSVWWYNEDSLSSALAGTEEQNIPAVTAGAGNVGGTAATPELGAPAIGTPTVGEANVGDLGTTEPMKSLATPSDSAAAPETTAAPTTPPTSEPAAPAKPDDTAKPESTAKPEVTPEAKVEPAKEPAAPSTPAPTPPTLEAPATEPAGTPAPAAEATK